MFACVGSRPWLGTASLRVQLPQQEVLYTSCRAVSTASTTNDMPSGTASKQTDYLKYLPSALSYHWDTLPPTKAQLHHAETFFTKHPPTFLWSAPKFKSMSFGDSPEVCFLGRSNVGKSSLLNTLLGKKMAHTSS